MKKLMDGEPGTGGGATAPVAPKQATAQAKVTVTNAANTEGSTLKTIFCEGAPVAVPVLEALEAQLSGHPFEREAVQIVVDLIKFGQESICGK